MTSISTIHRLKINGHLIAEFLENDTLNDSKLQNLIKITDTDTGHHVCFHHSALKYISSLLDNRKL